MIGKVIVVDDDAVSASLISKLLQRSRCEALVFTDAEQAVSRALLEDVDLVSLDIGMPTLDGYSVLSLIRSHEHTKRSPSVPIIAVTGKVADAERAAALAAGFAAFLAKPVRLDELDQVLLRVATLRSELHRTRYSIDHASIVERIEASIVVRGPERIQALAGLALSLERQGRSTLEHALVDAYASHFERGVTFVDPLIELAESIGAWQLCAASRALMVALPKGSEAFEHEAVLLRAELDRVVYTLRERVLR